jgi:NTE family protein
MAIKNFLFLVVLLTLLVSGCNTFHHREDQGNQPVGPVGEGQAPAQPTPRKASDYNIPQTLPPALFPQPGRTLPVGVFLGPGAMRSYAHIGVLRALQRAQVPIVAIGGMEWGSIMAASYALGKSANQVEWEMMKLKREELPTSGLLNRELKPKDPQDLFNFLNVVFGNKDLSQGGIPFRCATTDGNQVEFISRGKAREQLIRCAALPPLYGFYERAGRHWISGALSPGDWPAEFKKLGVQYIIYVDVISHGNFLTEKTSGQPDLKALWVAVKAISSQQHIFSNFNIDVDSDMDLSDFEHRRDAIALGEKAAAVYLPEISKAIGLH